MKSGTRTGDTLRCGTSDPGTAATASANSGTSAVRIGLSCVQTKHAAPRRPREGRLAVPARPPSAITYRRSAPLTLALRSAGADRRTPSPARTATTTTDPQHAVREVNGLLPGVARVKPHRRPSQARPSFRYRHSPAPALPADSTAGDTATARRARCVQRQCPDSSSKEQQRLPLSAALVGARDVDPLPDRLRPVGLTGSPGCRRYSRHHRQISDGDSPSGAGARPGQPPVFWRVGVPLLGGSGGGWGGSGWGSAGERRLAWFGRTPVQGSGRWCPTRNGPVWTYRCLPWGKTTCSSHVATH